MRSTRCPVRPALVLLAVSSLVGCATAPSSSAFTPPKRQLAEVTDPNLAPTVKDPILIYDPYEETNRAIYKFNAQFDRYIYIPVVNAYTYVTPTFVRTRIGNFFRNLGEVPTFANSILQAKVDKAVPTLFRFMINSTIGLLGLFDPASNIGLKRQQEDFGQTLGVWGLGDGPYIVLPILGPSNLRDATGTGTDFALEYALLTQVPSDVRNDLWWDLTFYGLYPVDARYQNDFRYYSTGSPFEYDLVRYFVTKARQAEIKK